MTDTWEGICPTCKGSNERMSPFDPLEGCPDCHKGKIRLEVEELCDDCPTPDVHTCWNYPCAKDGSKCEPYRPLSTVEVGDLEFITESYEGYPSLTTKQWIKVHGIEKLVECYLQVIDNPMTSLTYKGQRVRVGREG